MTSCQLPRGAYALADNDSTFTARMRRVFNYNLHGGVDPNFFKATRDIYFRELLSQLRALERYNEEIYSKPLRARLRLIRSVRTSHLVRYSRTHWVELNTCQVPLLEQLYQSIKAIRTVRRSLLSSGSIKIANTNAIEVAHAKTFRLINQLIREGFRFAN